MPFTCPVPLPGKGKVVLRAWLCASALIAFFFFTHLCAEEAAPSSAQHQMTMLEFLKAGQEVGWIIVFLSFVGVALAVEQFLIIRRQNLIPPSFVTEVQAALDQKRYEQALELSQGSRSFIGAVMAAGLADLARGKLNYEEMVEAMQGAGALQASRLYRKIEALSVISRIAPMLGLLGTVTGMIKSFNIIAHTEGVPKPADLAQGISEALVTTCEGLIVAIPLLCLVSYFRQKLDGLISEAEATVEHLTKRFKK